MKTIVIVALVVIANCSIAAEPWSQEQLEHWIWTEGVSPQDDFVNLPAPEYVPQWRRDAVAEYRDFIVKGGWTTNQLIDALILATTNHLQSPSWPAQRDYVIALFAFKALSEINHPRSLSFVANICTNGVKDILGGGVAGVFRYSQYEPEVFDYMRKLCVMTNRYAGVVGMVALDLEECLGGVPIDKRQVATNRVAKFDYFVLRHATTDLGIVDSQLAEFLPAYSNSIQRLSAMRYVSGTTTNVGIRIWATNQVNRLLALPTNQLNNVSWLEE